MYKSVISLLSCFAAGVFLATCLLDLFPEVKEQMSAVLNQANIQTPFPVPEFLLTFGLFLVLLVEQIVLMAKEKPRVAHKSVLNYGGGSARRYDGNTYEDDILRSDITERSSLLRSDSDYETTVEEDHYDADEETKETPTEDPNEHSMIRSFILLAALSLHSVFEGLAVGLQPNTHQVLQIFIALVLHKCILAFSLGLNLVQSKLSISAIIKSNLTFCVMSPLGIGIGIAITDFTDSLASSLVSGILQGLASGTFLYIVFLEILPYELSAKRRYPNRMLKVLLLLLGYSAVALIQFLDPTTVNENSDSPAHPAKTFH